MMVQVKPSVFPFVVKSFSLERVQFWAQYAAQASTKEQLLVAQYAFNALYWEENAFFWYESAVSDVQRYGFLDALRALDELLDVVLYLSSGEHCWFRVCRDLAQVLGKRAKSDRWYQDAVAQSDFYASLASQVAQYIYVMCAEHQLALPEHTKAFLDEMASSVSS